VLVSSPSVRSASVCGSWSVSVASSLNSSRTGSISRNVSSKFWVSLALEGSIGGMYGAKEHCYELAIKEGNVGDVRM